MMSCGQSRSERNAAAAFLVRVLPAAVQSDWLALRNLHRQSLIDPTCLLHPEACVSSPALRAVLGRFLAGVAAHRLARRRCFAIPAIGLVALAAWLVGFLGLLAVPGGWSGFWLGLVAVVILAGIPALLALPSMSVASILTRARPVMVPDVCLTGRDMGRAVAAFWRALRWLPEHGGLLEALGCSHRAGDETMTLAAAGSEAFVPFDILCVFHRTALTATGGDEVAADLLRLAVLAGEVDRCNRAMSSSRPTAHPLAGGRRNGLAAALRSLMATGSSVDNPAVPS